MLGTPPSLVQFLSFSCSFLENLANKNAFQDAYRPLVDVFRGGGGGLHLAQTPFAGGNRSNMFFPQTQGKSWVCHCTEIIRSYLR